MNLFTTGMLGHSLFGGGLLISTLLYIGHGAVKWMYLWNVFVKTFSQNYGYWTVYIPIEVHEFKFDEKFCAWTAFVMVMWLWPLSSLSQKPPSFLTSFVTLLQVCSSWFSGNPLGMSWEFEIHFGDKYSRIYLSINLRPLLHHSAHHHALSIIVHHLWKLWDLSCRLWNSQVILCRSQSED